jgi:hypothetical protein
MEQISNSYEKERHLQALEAQTNEHIRKKTKQSKKW